LQTQALREACALAERIWKQYLAEQAAGEREQEE
jgi:hypothetical protein